MPISEHNETLLRKVINNPQPVHLFGLNLESYQRVEVSVSRNASWLTLTFSASNFFCQMQVTANNQVKPFIDLLRNQKIRLFAEEDLPLLHHWGYCLTAYSLAIEGPSCSKS